MVKAGAYGRQPPTPGAQFSHLAAPTSTPRTPQRQRGGGSARAPGTPVREAAADRSNTVAAGPRSPPPPAPKDPPGAEGRPGSAPLRGSAAPRTAPLSERNVKALAGGAARTHREGFASTMSVCSSRGGMSQWSSGRTEAQGPGAATFAGMEMGFSKTNQDSSFVFRRKRGGGDVLCGVIDGHGANGHFVSEFVRDNLAPQILEQRRVKSSDGMRAALAHGFVDTAKKLDHRRDIDAKESGAVVAVCMKKGKDLYVANVGDTRAVLAYEDDSGRMKAQALTRDHTASLKSEQQRIKAKGGEIAQIYVPNVGFAGPPRVWQRSQGVGGLMVTRAIGDTNLNPVGVTAEPEVVKHRVRPCDKLVVMASDGCWDYVSNDRVVEIASQHPDPRQASEAVVQEARRAWRRAAGGGDRYRDDITCMVLKV